MDCPVNLHTHRKGAPDPKESLGFPQKQNLTQGFKCKYFILEMVLGNSGDKMGTGDREGREA